MSIARVFPALEKLGVSWKVTTQIAQFYASDIPDLWRYPGPLDLWTADLLGRLGAAIRQGVLVYRTRPSLLGAEVELEARTVRQEPVVSTL